jgi:hypothetical protein
MKRVQNTFLKKMYYVKNMQCLYSAISPYKYVLPTRWMTGSFQVKIVYTATLSFFQSIQKKKRKFKPGVH